MKKIIFIFLAFTIYQLTFNICNCLGQWVQTGLLNGGKVRSLAVSESNIFAGTASGLGVFKTTNEGTNWNQTSLNNVNVYSLLVNGSNIFAGATSNKGVYISTNNGTTWTQTSLYNQSIRSLAVSGSTILAGTSLNGVFISTDNGTS